MQEPEIRVKRSYLGCQLEGGKFERSAWTPTIVTRGGQPVLVLGAGGNDAIYRAVTEVIVNYIDFRMDIGHAVDAQRYHAFQDEIGPYAVAEDARISPEVLDELESRGQVFDFGFGEYAPSSAMANVEVAGISRRTGERLGAPDPRSDGSAKGQ